MRVYSMPLKHVVVKLKSKTRLTISGFNFRLIRHKNLQISSFAFKINKIQINLKDFYFHISDQNIKRYLGSNVRSGLLMLQTERVDNGSCCLKTRA